MPELDQRIAANILTFLRPQIEQAQALNEIVQALAPIAQPKPAEPPAP